MITTVTLNPCIDKTVNCENFGPNKLNRVAVSQLMPSGKGINSSVVFEHLGAKTCCIGFNYAENGQILEDFLSGLEIPFEFVRCLGLLRTNTKIFDTLSKTMTELNEYGSPVSEEQISAFLELAAKYAKLSDVVILSGSVPRGVGEDIYREACAVIRKNSDAKIIVDAEKKLLERTFDFAPDIIKPNTFELGELVGRQISTKEDIILEARNIIARGVKTVAVSMGSEGAMIVDKDAAFFAPILPVEVKGLQGAGDSMVAGMSLALAASEGIGQMLKKGVAAAGGSVMLPGTMLCEKKDFDRLAEMVKLERLD